MYNKYWFTHPEQIKTKYTSREDKKNGEIT